MFNETFRKQPNLIPNKVSTRNLIPYSKFKKVLPDNRILEVSDPSDPVSILLFIARLSIAHERTVDTTMGLGSKKPIPKK